MPRTRTEDLTLALGLVAPGTHLREGLDRILQARMGALIVVGDSPEVLGVCTGGFLIDTELTPQRLSELAKMDGAIILASDCSRIARANVHLVPDSRIATAETGTRHRTAQRVARQLDVPVISVSEELAIVSVYRGDEKLALEDIPRVLSRATHALQILERYKSRLDVVSDALSTLEVEGSVTGRDVAGVLQRIEMVLRIASEIEDYIVELGTDGRLVLLQLEELVGGVESDRSLILRDYATGKGVAGVDVALAALVNLATDDLLTLHLVIETLGPPGELGLDGPLEARGYRLLHRIPRLPDAITDRVVEHFSGIQQIMKADVSSLHSVEGVGETRALAIKEGLARIAESALLDHFV